MAKKSLIVKNKKINLLSEKYYKNRLDLKDRIKKEFNFGKKVNLVQQLASLPRNSSRTRYRNRCNLSGRARAFIRYFKLSRISFRELSS